MNLTSLGAASRNVGSVIDEVCKLCHKTPDRMPARTTVDKLMDTEAALAQKQLLDVASREEAQQLSLMSDETTKYGTKYYTEGIDVHGPPESYKFAWR